MQGFSMGQTYTDITKLGDNDAITSCTKYAASYAAKVNALYSTLTGTALSQYTGTFMNTLLSSGNDILILTSELNDQCQNIYKIKQFSTRTNSLSGFFNMLFTVGYSYFKKETIYTSVQALTGFKTLECNKVGFQLANLMMAVLQTSTAVDTNSEQVSAFGSGLSSTSAKV
jgi:hypothetical protein